MVEAIQTLAGQPAFLVALIVGLIVMVSVEVSRWRLDPNGELTGLQVIAKKFPRVTWLFLLASWALLGWALIASEQVNELKKEAEARDNQIGILQRQLAETEPAAKIDGVPFRVPHPKRLGGVYYRGNDERDPQLYNGGYYLTAELKLHLVDENKQRLGYDSAVDPKQPLMVEFEISRAPHSSPLLFSDKVMSRIFLSRRKRGPSNEIEDSPVPLEVVEKDQRWRGYYPVPMPEASGTGRSEFDGLIYVYVGDYQQRPIKARWHYGIGLDLKIENGRILKESELWMGAIYMPQHVLIPNEKQVTTLQWLDYRPMPLIDREQSVDSKLIGVDDYRDLLGKDDKAKKKNKDENP